MSRLLLCLDTAGSRCAVALCGLDSGEIVARAEPDIGRGHAEVLMGLVEECLASAGAGYGDLGKIAVVVGPGSFTGLRVGVAAAKGLAIALGIPAIGISSLETLAEPHWHDGKLVLAVIDAKRGEVYAALYGQDGLVLAEPCALAPGDLADWIVGAAVVGEIIAVGNGAAIAAAELGGFLVETVNLAGDTDIAFLARIGLRRAAAGPVRPLYLRGADAKPQAATGILHTPPSAILP